MCLKRKWAYNSLSIIAAMLWLHEEQSMNDDFRYPLILSWTTQFCYYLFEDTGGVPYGEKVSSKTHLTVPVSCHIRKNINISGVPCIQTCNVVVRSEYTVQDILIHIINSQ